MLELSYISHIRPAYTFAVPRVLARKLLRDVLYSWSRNLKAESGVHLMQVPIKRVYWLQMLQFSSCWKKNISAHLGGEPALGAPLALRHWLCCAFVSRSYCYTVWSAIAIGFVMSVYPNVCLSVCNAVHCGAESRWTRLKVVPACSQQATSYTILQTFLL